MEFEMPNYESFKSIHLLKRDKLAVNSGQPKIDLSKARSGPPINEFTPCQNTGMDRVKVMQKYPLLSKATVSKSSKKHTAKSTSTRKRKRYKTINMRKVQSKYEYFYSPYKQDSVHQEEHMKFGQEQSIANWSKVSSIILSKQRDSNSFRSYKKVFGTLNDMKNSKSKFKTKSKEMSDRINVIKIRHKSINARISSPKKSTLKRLHKDVLAEKIFNINYKMFNRKDARRLQARKTVENTRRLSKFSTHDPAVIENLISINPLESIQSKGTHKSNEEGDNPKKCNTEASVQEADFKINIGQASDLTDNNPNLQVLTSKNNIDFTATVNESKFEEEEKVGDFSSSSSCSIASVTSLSSVTSQVSVNENMKLKL